MTLSEMMYNYLKEHNLSYAQFAEMSGLSKGYISMLINNRNPKTGKPPIPTLETYFSLARCFGMSLDNLLIQIDDAPIQLTKTAEASKPTATTFVEHNNKHVPDLEKAAFKAMETLIKYKVSKVPVFPMSILLSMPNVIIMTFTELADKSGMDRSNMVTMFGAENQDVLVYEKNNMFYVAYNQRLPYYMLQRAMARELGHIILGHHASTIPEHIKIAEALFFMRYLLCPRPLLKALFDEGILITVETLGNITGLYGRSLAGIRKTPGVLIPAKMNRKVHEQFSGYIASIAEYMHTMSQENSISPANFGTYMDNYEE